MLRLMRRWLLRVVVVLVVGFVAVYPGDWAVFKFRGSPLSKVTVNRYLTIPLKGNKQEFDYLGTMDVPCSVSLFPQAGQRPLLATSSQCEPDRQDVNRLNRRMTLRRATSHYLVMRITFRNVSAE